MTDFGSALERARRQAAIIERFEGALRQNPHDRSLQIGLRTARRKAEETFRVFELAAGEAHVEVLSYRIERPTRQYPALAIAESVSAFQRLLFGVVDAVANGAKTRARYSRELIESASLNFAYSFPGSTGLVFSIAKQEDLFREGQLDRAISEINQIANVTSAAQALEKANSLGLAAISQVYNWVDTNAYWDNEVDYVWTAPRGEQSGQRVTRDQFRSLKEILQNVVESTAGDIDVYGSLVGLDLNRRTFHFISRDEEDFLGKLSEDFTQLQALVGQGVAYRAKIRAMETKHPATGKTDTAFLLRSLEVQEI